MGYTITTKKLGDKPYIIYIYIEIVQWWNKSCKLWSINVSMEFD